MIGIYKFENKINHKCYIGQSINLEKRRLNHLHSAYNEKVQDYNSQFHQAIRKYNGIENFDYTILELLTPEEYTKQKLNELEIYYIEKYDSYKNGYNATRGGDYSMPRPGELNGRAILTEKEVIYIRECYNAHIPFRVVYQEFSGRITKRCLQKVWSFDTWKHILPEYQTEENKYFHSHQAKGLESKQASSNASKMSKKQHTLNSMTITVEEVYKIRELYDKGIKPQEIKEKLNLNIQPEAIRRIGKRIRCGAI